jgi:DNA-3-methyladenine glycosylase II
MRRAKGLETVPTRAEQEVVAEAWRPWRAVAARLLWHAYLAGER